MSTFNKPDDFDPMVRGGEPDEPYFMVVARDPVASETVRDWVKRRRSHLNLGQYTDRDGHNAMPEDVKDELRQINHAEDIADQIDDWRREQGLPVTRDSEIDRS